MKIPDLITIYAIAKEMNEAGTYSPQAVAAKAFDVPVEEVTQGMRSTVKVVAHSIVYGLDRQKVQS